MNKQIVFELCAETLEACLVAHPGNADRIELCTRLDVGGLTPDTELIQAAIQQSGVPVHVLLLPQASAFVYTPSLFEEIAASLHQVRELGAAGVVLGLLNADLTVDIEHTTDLVRMAAGMEVTFHRAFDVIPDKKQALRDVISTGCSRLLTSGGAPDVLTGASTIARLVEQAGDRINVTVAGGLTLQNAQQVAEQTQAPHYHASLRSPRKGDPVLLLDRIQSMTGILVETCASFSHQ